MPSIDVKDLALGMNDQKQELEKALRLWWCALSVREVAANQKMISKVDRLHTLIHHLDFL